MGRLCRQILAGRACLASAAVSAWLLTVACQPTDGHDDQRGTEVPPSASLNRSSWVLPIPARLQWDNDHGYCGETSIQSIGLYYGAWNSQQVVRGVGGGEILIGINAAQVLGALHFQYEEWGREQARPQFKQFMVWLKTHLARGNPAVIATYLTDASDPDYDHIIPVTGIEAANPNPAVYDAKDLVTYNSNQTPAPVVTTFGKIGRTRNACRAQGDSHNCIPTNVDYGIAVTGIVDTGAATRPVRLTVDAADEPNVSLGKPRGWMHATATVSGLVKNATYALLRYNDYRKVPAADSAAAWLAAPTDRRTDFTATGETWSFADPEPLPSDGSVYYRCVPVSKLDDGTSAPRDGGPDGGDDEESHT